MSALAQMDPGLLDPEVNDGQQAADDNPPDSLPSQVRTYGKNNQDLPEELQQALLALARKAQEQDLYQRRLEVVRDRQNRFYERGMQHVYADLGTGIFVAGTPGGWVPDGDRELQCGNYIEDYNIFGRALQIIIAKLTENPPGVDFQPDSANDSVDEQAAEAAEAYRLLYDRRNEIKELLTSIVRMMGVSGRTITWTRTVADAQRWGTDKTGAPVEAETTNVYGTLESKVPIMAKSINDWPYCILTDDKHVLILKKDYPFFADKIVKGGDDGIADTQFERMARIGALQGASASFQVTDTYEFYLEEKNIWFRPAMFTEECLDGDYESGTLRDAIEEAFPDGCQVTFVGSQYVGSRNATMDDDLAVDFPYAGDGMSRMAIMDPARVIQDRFNDDMNAYAEAKDFGWPSTWINGEKSEIAAVNDQTASPYAFRAWKSTSRDRPLQDQFFREPNPDIPRSFMDHTEYLATQLLQFILAIPSAVQGAGMPDQKTASGYTAALNQALGQLGVIWQAVQRLMARVYQQAALHAARADKMGKVLVIPTPKGSTTLNVADLGKGRFLAHPDIDSGFPESTLQKRQTLGQLFTLAAQDPMVFQQLVQSPDNWDFIFRTMGIPELVIPEAVVRRKQLAEIELLLQQSPVMPTPEEIQEAQVEHAAQTMAAQAAGGQAQPFDPASLEHSSIQPGQLDYHDWEFEECREFLSNYPKVQQEIARGNQAGVQNVFLHALEHQKFMQEQAMAQAKLAAAAQPPQPKVPPKGKPPQPEQQTPSGLAA